VDGVSLSLAAGRTLAVVGESGCGKSALALSVLRLLPPAGRVQAGRVLLDGEDLLALPPAALRSVRGRRVAMVFQEPMTSLNPMLRVGDQVAEALLAHPGAAGGRPRGQALRARVEAALGDVRIADPARAADAYPHQLSGGMRQRAMLAMALAGDPALLIADEPTTALDVTVQAGVLRLLRELTDDLGLAVLLVTHDLGVMSAVADTVAVMRNGVVVEHGSRYQVIRDPQTAYARELVESLPHTPPPGVGEEDA